MNDVNARSVRVTGGYEGQFCKVHRSGWDPVCLNGVAQVYCTVEMAELAAWRALRAHLCGDIVGDGPKSALSAGEKAFRRIFPGKGKKPVEVVRR